MFIPALLSPARRITLFVCVSTLALVGTASPALADGKNRDAEMLTTAESVVLKGHIGFDTRTGEAIDLDPLRVVNNIIDAATGEILRTGNTRFSVSPEGPTDDVRSCVESNKRKGLTIYSPMNKNVVSDKGSIQVQYHPYRLQEARQLSSGRSTQWEVCSKSGAQMTGARLKQVGTGIALDDGPAQRRIGYEWMMGKTPEDYSLELAFQVEKKPVTIGASISQHPSDKLLGGFRGPYESYMDAYELDAVNAWWQDNCIGRWYGCVRNSGSHDFQGAIAHGLWEFPQGTEPAVVGFYYTPYARF